MNPQAAQVWNFALAKMAQAYAAARKILGMIAGLSPPEDPLPAP